MLNKGTASLEVSRSHEQRLEPRVREFREFGTASLRGITVHDKKQIGNVLNITMGKFVLSILPMKT